MQSSFFIALAHPKRCFSAAMLKIKNVQYVKSLLSAKERPKPALPEIAFVGRSNVGKSSLINCLVNIKNFARVSKQPGKTRMINYFSVDNAFYLVDLPGYGFAKVARSAQVDWQQMIEAYLLNNPQLRCILVLIDSKVGAKENDRQLVEWLEFNRAPYRLVATKVDKISRSERAVQARKIREALNQDPQKPLLFFSAKDRTGREDILKYIAELLEGAGN